MSFFFLSRTYLTPDTLGLDSLGVLSSTVFNTLGTISLNGFNKTSLLIIFCG